jgi:PHP family Zn ribbon phosphoesterase
MHARTETPHPADRHVDIPSEWLDFGPDDPLDASRWLNACAACGAQPSLDFADLRWQVRCDCGQCGTQAQLSAIAAVNWNKSPLSRHPHYRELPFFDLAGLTVPQARAKLVAVREYLEEQKRRCERRIRARENFGHRYYQRIRAYLAWAIYAQGLVKEVESMLMTQGSRPQ